MIRIRVPATSANLGPGFDCLGLAVGLYLEVRACPSEHDCLIYRGDGQVADHPDNLIHQGFRAAYQEAGQAPPRIRFEADNPIPLARGLGSSSAALVAGAALADAVMGGPLGREGVFQLAARMEGHPDNVAPAVYGGFTVSAERAEGGYLTQSLPIPEGWQLLFAVPDFELLTSEARAVLPEHYTRRDTVLTASRSALWTAAVALNRPDLLRVAARDVLHEPYREPLVPGLADCRRRLYEAGAVAAYLSGAGPTLAVICHDKTAAERCKIAAQAFVGQQGRLLAPLPSPGYSYQPSTPVTPTPTAG